MLEAKVIFFTDNETYNWFEQFLKTRVPCCFLCLVGLEKLTKGEKKGARGEEADLKKKKQEQNENVAIAANAGGINTAAAEAGSLCCLGRFGSYSCGDTCLGQFCVPFFRMLVIWQFVIFFFILFCREESYWGKLSEGFGSGRPVFLVVSLSASVGTKTVSLNNRERCGDLRCQTQFEPGPATSHFIF